MLGLSVTCTVAAVAWIYLLAAHGGYWRTTERLPRVAAEPDAWPHVVAVVPARNEAGMLPVTLPTLLGQDYPGSLAVIVVDDGSSDGTGEVAARVGRAAPAAGDRRHPAARRRALGGQGLGHGPGPARGRTLRPGAGWLPAVHRRRHRLGGAPPAPAGGRGGGGRPGPGLADGPAADGGRLGARRGSR